MKTKVLIDAVAARLETLALPTHPLYKYHRPLTLTNSRGVTVPALAVSPAVDKPMQLATNGQESWVHRFLVTWYAGQMSAITQGRADEEMAAATLDHVGLMIDEMAAWDVQVPGVAFQAEATLGDVHYGTIEGGIWTCEMNLSIQHWES